LNTSYEPNRFIESADAVEQRFDLLVQDPEAVSQHLLSGKMLRDIDDLRLNAGFSDQFPMHAN
jgi:hypothetical protein